jgi:hypothetical protein
MTIVDHHVAALGVALLGQTLPKNSDERVGQPARGEQSHYWNGGVLRPRRERVRSRAGEQRDELASFQLVELHSIPASQCRIEQTTRCALASLANLATARAAWCQACGYTIPPGRQV